MTSSTKVTLKPSKRSTSDTVNLKLLEQYCVVYGIKGLPKVQKYCDHFFTTIESFINIVQILQDDVRGTKVRYLLSRTGEG